MTKNGLKRLLAHNLPTERVKWAPRKKSWSFLRAASTADANVTNASFKSSTVPLLTTILACEPSERKSKETAAV